MRFGFASGPLSRSTGDLLLVPLFESDLSEPKERSQAFRELDDALDGLLVRAASEESFKAKAEQTFAFHTHGKVKAPRIVLLGLGSRTRFEPEALRLATGRAVKVAVKLKAKEVTLALPVMRDLEAGVKAAVEGMVLGGYKFDRYRTTPVKDGAEEKKGAAKAEKLSVKLLLPEGQAKNASLEAAVALAERVGLATNHARDLVNEPAGVMTPSKLADEAKRAAKEAGLKFWSGGWKEIRQLKMGMFEGVAQGSMQEPQLVKLSYIPSDPRQAAKPPLVLVGKAITFDSGGLSIKTAEGMMEMKTDMAGSAAVIGAMSVVPHLAPPFPVHGIFGACENMPSGHAYRPGDVLISKAGKTVEVLNTDAEGRLVLGDMLTWATELKPAAIIDLATLTGACIVALGNFMTGAWGEDDPLVFSVLEAAKRAGEHVWRMPLIELQRDSLRSEIADMKNIGERWGGAINAAMFLREFVGETPWVHLDIAGPSMSPKDRGYYSKGPTGVGVRTLVELIRSRSDEPTATDAAPVRGSAGSGKRKKKAAAGGTSARREA